MSLQFHSIETIEKFVNFIFEKKSPDNQITKEDIWGLLLNHSILKDHVIVNITEPFRFRDPRQQTLERRNKGAIPMPLLIRCSSVSENVSGRDRFRDYDPTGPHLATYTAQTPDLEYQTELDDKYLEWLERTLRITGEEFKIVLQLLHFTITHEDPSSLYIPEADQADGGGAAQQPDPVAGGAAGQARLPEGFFDGSQSFVESTIMPVVVGAHKTQDAFIGLVAYRPHKEHCLLRFVAELRPALSEEDAETLEGIIKSGGIRQYFENKVRDAILSLAIFARVKLPEGTPSGADSFPDETLMLIGELLANVDNPLRYKCNPISSDEAEAGGASEQKDPREEKPPKGAAATDSEAPEVLQLQPTIEAALPLRSLMGSPLPTIPEQKAVRLTNTSGKTRKNKPTNPKGFGRSDPRFGPNTSFFNRGRRHSTQEPTLKGILQQEV